jgi:hypothetical protein
LDAFTRCAGEKVMIVKDKIETLKRAEILSADLMTYVGKRCIESSSEYDDDPAEHIYMSVHAIGMLCTRLALTLEEYGKIYGIENLTAEKIAEWLSLVISEHIEFNRKPLEGEGWLT